MRDMVDFLFNETRGITLKCIVIVTSLLIILALIPFLISWSWSPFNSELLYPLYLVTVTANTPELAITSLVFTLFLLFFYRFSFKKTLIFIIFINGLVFSSQCAVYVVKQFAKEPRPYLVWLETNNLIKSSQSFYALDKNSKKELIKNLDLKDTNIPLWQQRHWEKKGVSYSFPSGHSVFAASWAIILVSLMLYKRRVVFASIFFIWAAGVVGSRIVFGMHFPRDVIASCLISAVVITFFMLLLNFLHKKEKL